MMVISFEHISTPPDTLRRTSTHTNDSHLCGDINGTCLIHVSVANILTQKMEYATLGQGDA